MNQLLWLGLMLLAWAAFLLVAARSGHERAPRLVQWMRGRGVDPKHILGVSYVASPQGLRGCAWSGRSWARSGLRSSRSGRCGGRR